MKDILRVQEWNDVFPTRVAVDFRIQPDRLLSLTHTCCAKAPCSFAHVVVGP